MAYKGLTKAYPIRLTLEQEKALNILQSKGFRKSAFIRIAIEEKLYRDYRNMIKQLEPNKYPF